MDSSFLVIFSSFTAILFFVVKLFKMKTKIEEKEKIINYQEKILIAQETARHNRKDIIDAKITPKDILKKYGNLRDE